MSLNDPPKTLDPPLPPETPETLPGIPHDLTPQKRKEQNQPYVANSDVSQPESANIIRWVTRMQRHLSVYSDSVDEFINKYVPSSAVDYDPPANLGFSAVPREHTENEMYGPLVESLTKLVAHVEEPRRLTFTDSNLTTFAAVHGQKPDIAFLHPGDGGSTSSTSDSPMLPSEFCCSEQYRRCAGVIEVRAHEWQDPIQDGKIHVTKSAKETIVQIAKNARNLIVENMSCFVFVIGIYGHQARIYRFDRAGAIVSPSFNYVENYTILGRFFYRLVHPPAPATAGIVGADHTIAPATEEEKISVLFKLLHGFSYGIQEGSMAVMNSHRIQVRYGNDASTPLIPCFTVGDCLSGSAGLFGRATIVWIVVFLEREEQYVLKDSWRECHRRAEYTQYESLTLRGHREPNTPLADCVGSVDMGKEMSADGGYRTLSMMPDILNRTRNRLLLYPVGHTLESFSSTRSLVEGIRDAVKGYWVAWQSKILHRDISIGNVMLVGPRARAPQFKGFLHDFDYSMDLQNGQTNPEVEKSLKDMTGTFQFMAVEILDSTPHTHAVCHDLESFYWIFVWIALRHLRHNHPDREFALAKLFEGDGSGDDEKRAGERKRHWLKANHLAIDGNPPLSEILSDMTELCSRWVLESREGQKEEDWYQEFLGIMEKGLQRTDWPKNDGAKVMSLITSVKLGRTVSRGHKTTISRKRKSNSKVDSVVSTGPQTHVTSCRHLPVYQI